MKYKNDLIKISKEKKEKSSIQIKNESTNIKISSEKTIKEEQIS